MCSVSDGSLVAELLDLGQVKVTIWWCLSIIFCDESAHVVNCGTFSKIKNKWSWLVSATVLVCVNQYREGIGNHRISKTKVVDTCFIFDEHYSTKALDPHTYLVGWWGATYHKPLTHFWGYFDRKSTLFPSILIEVKKAFSNISGIGPVLRIHFVENGTNI